MKTEAQRIAIAEACGWADVRRPIDDSYHTIDTDTLGWLMGRVAGVKPGERVHKPLPDYLNDLNAMHEAEKQALKNPDQWAEYWTTLDGLCGYEEAPWSTGCAPAELRAKALLQTLGTWTND